MSTVIHAIYENGVIRPFEPLELKDGDEVDVFLLKKELVDPKDSSRILSEIAQLPLEGETTPFSGEAHDEILYREDQQ
jgi:predicted DNA-binding antitoxin AbrB/MazE fold protein